MLNTLLDLLADATRWLHVLAAIAWLGGGLWVRRLTLRAKPLLGDRAELEVWDTHSLSFWRTSKIDAPTPAELEGLVWSFNQMRTLVVSGVLLFGLIYYRQPLAYLVDPNIAQLSGREAVLASLLGLIGAPAINELVNRIPIRHRAVYLAASIAHALGWSWVYANLFSQHGAMIQIGAMIGVVIASNVLWYLYPRMREAADAVLRGQKPDPLDKLHWDRRGLHSFVAPAVVFLMLSSHMGSAVRANGHAFLTIATVLALSVAARWVLDVIHRNDGVMPMRLRWVAAALAVGLGLGLTSMASMQAGSDRAVALASPHAPAAVPAAQPATAIAGAPAPSAAAPVAQTALPLRPDAIVERRCSACHAAQPSFPGMASPPRGIVFTRDTLPVYAGLIAAVVQSGRMPPGNATDMQPNERTALAEWATDHAR